MPSIIDESIVKSVRGYLRALNDRGIHARKAVIFGSYAGGQPHEWSDIDLIVIAPELEPPRDHQQVSELWATGAVMDSRIEPIPCGPNEWETDRVRPILHIAREEGVVIELDDA